MLENQIYIRGEKNVKEEGGMVKQKREWAAQRFHLVIIWGYFSAGTLPKKPSERAVISQAWSVK